MTLNELLDALCVKYRIGPGPNRVGREPVIDLTSAYLGGESLKSVLDKVAKIVCPDVQAAKVYALWLWLPVYAGIDYAYLPTRKYAEDVAYLVQCGLLHPMGEDKYQLVWGVGPNKRWIYD